ncbi:MAG: hypothetical protein JO368_13295 [Acidimicrobiales bacterium]|nr:hypothetical protein [Acidimicrobiales bacterium]
MGSFALVENFDGSQWRVLMIVDGEDNANGIASELAGKGYQISVREHVERAPAWAASTPRGWDGFRRAG